MKKLFIFLFVFSFLFAMGCEQSQSTEPVTAMQNNSSPGVLQKPVFDKIVEAHQNLVDVFATQDAEAMAALYTQDAELMPPNGDFITGNAAVGAFWGSMFTAGFDGLTIETLEVYGNANSVAEVGLWTLFLNGENFDNGKFIVIWKKVQGKWYVHRDCFNSNNPAQ
jgi:ketosteroid isomerase-like protein